MAKQFWLTRDEAEYLVDLVEAGSRHLNIAAELREAFGMLTREEQLAAESLHDEADVSDAVAEKR
jgi:hypothetical protein